MASKFNFEISEESRNILQNRVEEISFVEKHYKLQRYVCCGCKKVTISHRIANCGDVFCYNCYAEYHTKPCPHCETNVQSYELDLEFETAVLELKVKCKFTANGCEEVVLLGNYQNHINFCKFAPENLIIKVNDADATAANKKLIEDVHQIKDAINLMLTEIIGLKGNMQKSTQQIGQEMDSRNVEAFKEIENLQQLEAKLHKFVNLQIDTVLQKHLETAELRHQHKDDYGDGTTAIFLWNISGVGEKLMGSKTYTYGSEVYISAPNGMDFRPVIFTFQREEDLHIKLAFTTADISASLPYLHSRKYILLDRSLAIEKEHIELLDCPSFKMNSHEDMMSFSLSATCFSPLHLLRGKSKYVKDDELSIKIILEPISILWNQIASQDGFFAWQINEYSKKTRDSMNGVKRFLTSEPFKTSPEGYTVHLRLYLNGNGQENEGYISILIYLIFGEHDESLSLPFNCQFIFRLMDQSDSTPKEDVSEEFTAEFKEDQLSRGLPRFVLKSTVESLKYLKNDSILIQTTLQIV